MDVSEHELARNDSEDDRGDDTTQQETASDDEADNEEEYRLSSYERDASADQHQDSHGSTADGAETWAAPDTIMMPYHVRVLTPRGAARRLH